MERFARAFMFVLVAAAVGLGAGCGSTSSGTFNTDKYWEKQIAEQPGGG
jgi:hypothetical protein